MKKILIYFFFLSANAFAQLPNTDIWLLDISSVKDSIILSNPVNITNRVGYDNQAAFSPDGKYILYTSIRDDKQSDIYKYDLKTRTISQFTKTATSEYSPTFMPDGKNISVVMVEPDSVQRLWKFPLKGGEPTCIMKDADSIGYHCWINKDSLALVMITEPASLYTVNIKTQKPKFFADNVSRCLFSLPDGGNGFLYMDQSKDKTWQIKNCSGGYDYAGTALTPIKLKGNSEDFAYLWVEKFTLLIFYGNGSSVTGLRYLNGNPCNNCNNAAAIGWAYIPNGTICNSDLAKYGINNITRIAVSPDGKKLAIVAESKQ